MLTLIELHYKYWKWHNLQRLWNIEHLLYRDEKYKKVAPKLWRHDMMM